MGRVNSVIGWLIWILPLMLLYFLGKIDFQVRNTEYFLIIITLLSFFIVVTLSAINRKK